MTLLITSFLPNVSNVFTTFSGMTEPGPLRISIGSNQHSFMYEDDAVCIGEMSLAHYSNLAMCKNAIKGRYVTMVTTQEDDLDLCEVKIYGKGNCIIQLMQ